MRKKVLVEKVIVSVKLEMPLTVIGRCRNLYDWEHRFVSLRDKATSMNSKKQYDTARALVKYAYTCGASLVETQHSSDSITFDLAFDPGMASSFLENVDEAVKGAIMV